ncbi:MAG: DivIVA domain-containing protein [Defluviitaleaceae bacterium]|nr:DivIVA domain-containing protein [Defluviitaleaceae bacterium]
MQEFTQVKKGYNPEEVDKYIGKLERTVDEYKEKDTAIAKAILSAQVAADNIIKNANAQAEDILANASSRLININKSIDKQKELIKNLQADYEGLLNKYLKDTRATDFLDVFASINELENYIVSVIQDKIEEDQESEPEPEPAPALVFKKAPAFEPAPDFETAQEFEPTPVFKKTAAVDESMPVFEPVSKFEPTPAFETAYRPIPISQEEKPPVSEDNENKDS